MSLSALERQFAAAAEYEQLDQADKDALAAVPKEVRNEWYRDREPAPEGWAIPEAAQLVNAIHAGNDRLSVNVICGTDATTITASRDAFNAVTVEGFDRLGAPAGDLTLTTKADGVSTASTVTAGSTSLGELAATIVGSLEG